MLSQGKQCGPSVVKKLRRSYYGESAFIIKSFIVRHHLALEGQVVPRSHSQGGKHDENQRRTWDVLELFLRVAFAHAPLVSNPTQWSLLFIFGFLYGSSKQQRNIVQLCTKAPPNRKPGRTSILLLDTVQGACPSLSTVTKPWAWEFFKHFTSALNTALCAVRKVYFSAQPNKLKHILNFEKYYPIEHIFVPACSSARKIHFFKF